MEWSKETYRLDELEARCSIPCVIHVNEGYYSDNDAEGFSQGDIIGIDRKMTLHKVAANFASPELRSYNVDKDYVELAEEILVPLNYKGKLTVKSTSKRYASVRDLANAAPRYASVLQNFTVKTEDKVSVIIQSGSLIELDRIIPGVKSEPDKLVIEFQHLDKKMCAAVPVTERARFRSEPDHNKYTIKEAIDRYRLPQVVSFVDDEIKKVYTQDLLEGIENMRTITETLQLNRLVTQNVLVGHYKPIDGTQQVLDSETFRKRTLIVLPLDHPDIRDIEVHELRGVNDIEDVYEEVFLVRNVSHDLDLIDGLYVEFASRPGVKMLGACTAQEKASSVQTEQTQDKPPPRPPRLGQQSVSDAPPPRPPPPPKDTGYVKPDGKVIRPPVTERKPQPVAKSTVTKPNTDEDDDEYIIPEPPVSKHVQPSFPSLAEAYQTAGDIPMKSSKYTLFSFLNKGKTPPNQTSPQPNRHRSPSPTTEAVVNDDLPIYDEVDDMFLLDGKQQPETKTHCVPPQMKVKPMAHVHPTSQSETPLQTRKDFSELSCTELIDRFKTCHMAAIAGICEREHLDGSFFKNVSDVELKKDFKLSAIDVVKFRRMKDENWVVHD